MPAKKLFASASCALLLASSVAPALATVHTTAVDQHGVGGDTGSNSAQEERGQISSNDDSPNAMTTDYASTSQDNGVSGAAGANVSPHSGTTTTGHHTTNAVQDKQQGPTQQKNEVVGRFVDQASHFRGYVVRTNGNGTNRYVVVPADKVHAAALESSTNAQPLQARVTVDNTGSTDTTQPLLKRMYEQLQKQALQLHRLQGQMARRNGDQALRTPPEHARNHPLDQVAHVIVDPLGHVQAIVLDSGVVLSSQDSSVDMKSSNDRQAPNTASVNDRLSSDTQQRRQAIIIFKPEQPH